MIPRSWTVAERRGAGPSRRVFAEADRIELASGAVSLCTNIGGLGTRHVCDTDEPTAIRMAEEILRGMTPALFLLRYSILNPKAEELTRDLME